MLSDGDSASSLTSVTSGRNLKTQRVKKESKGVRTSRRSTHRPLSAVLTVFTCKIHTGCIPHRSWWEGTPKVLDKTLTWSSSGWTPVDAPFLRWYRTGPVSKGLLRDNKPTLHYTQRSVCKSIPVISRKWLTEMLKGSSIISRQFLPSYLFIEAKCAWRIIRYVVQSFKRKKLVLLL